MQRAQKCLKHALNRPQKGHWLMQRAGAASRMSLCPQLGMYPLGDSNFCHSACVQEWLQKQHLCWSQVLMSVNEYANPRTDWSNSKIHLYMCLYSCIVLCIIKKKSVFRAHSSQSCCQSLRLCCADTVETLIFPEEPQPPNSSPTTK